VQQAINRDQSFSRTKMVVDGVRERGAQSVNLDVLYGLPHQTVDGVRATAASVLSLAPDRIALFGYAHVPWFKKHQTMIDEAHLPGPEARFEQFAAAADLITAVGYDTVGLDHFARPSDRMAVASREGRLRRNFQGYTVDGADALIGLGASSISQFPQGYLQNTTATGAYERMAHEGGLAAARGYALTDADRMRAWIIERLMCDFGFSRNALLVRFGEEAKGLLEEAERIAAHDEEGLFVGSETGFHVTSRGRPFVRAVAAAFDAHLDVDAKRHSAAI
jgi:oxygen-independent coproporphyrinogen-3 oxidase